MVWKSYFWLLEPAMAMLLLDSDMFGLADGRTPQTPPLDVLGHREWGGGGRGESLPTIRK